MSNIELAFYKGWRSENDKAHFFDRMICWWTNGRFSHVELIEDRHNGLCRSWTASERDRVVRRTSIDLRTGRWVIVRLPGYDRQHALNYMRMRSGTLYDYIGAARFVLPFLKVSAKRLFCSNCCAYAIAHAATAVAPALPAPKDFIHPSALYEWMIAQPGAMVISQF